MLLLGAVSALAGAVLAGSAGAWWLSGRRLRLRPVSRSGLEAQAALWRHPAGRARWPERELPPSASPADARPPGPDDDPEFIRALERLIRGDHGEPV